MSAKAVMFVIVLLLLVLRQAECNDVEQQSIVDRLFKDYRKEVRPNADALRKGTFIWPCYTSNLFSPRTYVARVDCR